MRFFRRLWCRLFDHAWRSLDAEAPSWCRRCGDRAPGTKKIDWKKFNWHYDDCELEPGWEGCWCEHRGASSHYGGGIKPGWHRESCPMVGIAWIMPPDPKDGMELNEYWKRGPCDCQRNGYGQYILTFKNGTVHGPAPSPMPREEDCIVISGEEINAILAGVEKKDKE